MRVFRHMLILICICCFASWLFWQCIICCFASWLFQQCIILPTLLAIYFNFALLGTQYPLTLSSCYLVMFASGQGKKARCGVPQRIPCTELTCPLTFLSWQGLMYHVNTFHQDTHWIHANHPQSPLPHGMEFDNPQPHLVDSLPNMPPGESPPPMAHVQAQKGVKIYHPILNGVFDFKENRTTDKIHPIFQVSLVMKVATTFLQTHLHHLALLHRTLTGHHMRMMFNTRQLTFSIRE